MMLMCNLPLEILEIHKREWPLSTIACKLRNICAEFFTCSSILTILAFTCERYFAIVHSIHFHRLSHFCRAQNVIIIIWLISIGFSFPLGLLYEIRTDSLAISNNRTDIVFTNNNDNHTKLIQMNYLSKNLSYNCQACIPKASVAKVLSIIIIITSLCLFFFPMIIIGAIYLFIGKALHRASKYEIHSNRMKISMLPMSNNSVDLRKFIDNKSSNSPLSNKAVIRRQLRNSHISSYSRLRTSASYQARKVIIKTLGKILHIRKQYPTI